MAATKKSAPGKSRAPGALPDRSRKVGAGEVDAAEVLAQTSAGLVNFVYDHRVAISAAIVGIFAIAGASTLWRHFHENKNEEGIARIYEVTKKLPDDADPLANLGIDLSDVKRSDEEIARRNTAYLEVAQELEKVGDTYASVPAGHLAYLERGRLLKKAGKLDLAVEAFRKALESAGSEPTFQFAALSGLGNTLRDQEKYDEAETVFKQMADLEGFWRQQGLIELGRTQELKNDIAAAIATYKTFLEDFPNAAAADDVAARIETLKAKQAPSGGLNTAQDDDSGAPAGSAASSTDEAH